MGADEARDIVRRQDMEELVERLNRRPLRIVFGPTFRSSSVEVDGKALPVTGIDISLHGHDYTEVTLCVLGTRLQEEIVVEGVMQVISVDGKETDGQPE